MKPEKIERTLEQLIDDLAEAIEIIQTTDQPAPLRRRQLLDDLDDRRKQLTEELEAFRQAQTATQERNKRKSPSNLK